MVVELPSDLVEEILSWVTAKSLVRLRHTCKQWETLIAEPRFVKKHFSHMRFREQQVTVFNRDSTMSCVSIDFNNKRLDPCSNIHVFEPILPPNLSSAINLFHCDGLLLYVMANRLLVFNPLLRQGRWIKCDTFMDDIFGLGYVSNQSSSSCDHDYKIVRFHTYEDSRIEVYTFKSDSWKVVVDKTLCSFYALPTVTSVCLRGTPYWIGCNKDRDRQALTILSFDFSKERFEPLVLPPPLIEVYTFKSDSWKVVVDKTLCSFYALPTVTSVCLRGTPYWIGCNKDRDRQALTILSFDFSKERFEPLVLPPPLINGPVYLDSPVSLGIISGDQLSFSHLLRLRGEIHVWVKKKQHWSRLMTIAIRQVSEYFPVYSSFFIENNGKLVISFCHHRSISSYVVEENQECLKIEHNSCSSGYICVLCFYVPSLLRVPGCSRFLC